jgi:Protein of unknown function (DUF3311).
VKRPSVGSILFGMIPFVAVCFTVALWDRVDPIILGLPFNYFWLISWLLLTPLCMWGAYRLEAPRGGGVSEKQNSEQEKREGEHDLG